MKDSGNKRIAKNTAYTYLNMFVSMAIALYTSRIVMLILGISNYGLFGVVGGVIGMLTFFSGSIGGATSRFFNIELGKEKGDPNRSFNVNMVFHLGVALLVLLLTETVGLWYVYNKLNVAPERFGDALFIYQLSIVTFCLGTLNGPYAGLLGAHEKFKFMVSFDMINNLVRATLVILLQFYQGDCLRIYAVIMAMTSVNSVVVYHWMAVRHWPKIIKLRLVKEWKYYREVFAYSNWNLLTTLAFMGRGAGSDLLLNAFFGTAVNGAFTFSKTINQYVSQFSTNFDGPSAPQILQSYAKGDFARCNYLVNKLGRFCLLLFVLVFFPLYIELDLILELWLKVVPPNLLVFCRWNLILCAVSLTCGGIVQYINASGKIKWFKMQGAFFLIMCLPVSYILFRMGLPGYWLLIVYTIGDAMQRIVQLTLMHKILRFDSWRYVREAYMRPFGIAFILSAAMIAYWSLGVEATGLRLVAIAACGVLGASLVYTIGLTRNEKVKILNIIKQRVKKIRYGRKESALDIE